MNSHKRQLPKSYFTLLTRITKTIAMEKSQMNSKRKQLSKSCVIHFTRITYKIVMETVKWTLTKGNFQNIYHTFDKNNLNYCQEKKSNEFSQKAAFKTICQTLITITLDIAMVKYNMNFWKKATFKPYITLFTIITKKRHGQI